MAVKIVRQANKIALLGAQTSAAALSAGPEGAPTALRAAGIIERLHAIGYEVTDLGDDPPHVYKPDDESPRARNLPAIIAALEALRPRVELAVKTGALPLILSGDASVALATIAGIRRYFRDVRMIYVERDADMHTPATTTTGRVDEMVVAHLTGRGAAEMVRFWSEPPLVREPGVALFGIDRLDPSEEEALRGSPIRRYLAVDVQRTGAKAAARAALDSIHGSNHEFVLHLGVDAIADFEATNEPGTGGLGLEDVRDALEVFAIQPRLSAVEVTGYNPAKDSSGEGAKILVDLLASILAARLEALKAPAATATTSEAAAETADEGIKAHAADAASDAPAESKSESAESARPEEAAPGTSEDASVDARAPATTESQDFSDTQDEPGSS